jgi:hypothetical protein
VFRSGPPFGAVKTRSAERLPATCAASSSTRNWGIGTDRRWWFLGVPSISSPRTSVKATATVTRRRSRSSRDTRSADTSLHRSPVYAKKRTRSPYRPHASAHHVEDEHQGTGLVSPLPLTAAESTQPDACTCCENSAGPGASRDERWLRDTRNARWLAWASLAWMTAEGAIGLVAGITAGSIALTGWALGSAVEGLASIIVVWRFTGARTMSESAEDGHNGASRSASGGWPPTSPFRQCVTWLLTIRPPHRSWASR